MRLSWAVTKNKGGGNANIFLLRCSTCRTTVPLCSQCEDKIFHIATRADGRVDDGGVMGTPLFAENFRKVVLIKDGKEYREDFLRMSAYMATLANISNSQLRFCKYLKMGQNLILFIQGKGKL